MHPPERPSARAATTKTWLAAVAGLLTLAMAGVMMAFGAPANANAHPHADPRADAQPEGTLVSATMLQRLPAASVRAELASGRAEPGGPVLGSALVRDGITAYRVTYQTRDAGGHPALASGLDR